MDKAVAEHDYAKAMRLKQIFDEVQPNAEESSETTPTSPLRGPTMQFG